MNDIADTSIPVGNIPAGSIPAEAIPAAIEYITGLFSGNSGGHDSDHTMRVYRLAMRIAVTEPSCDPGIVAMAALLHDADDHKLFDTTGNANARTFLTGKQIDATLIDRICLAINEVSFSRNRGNTPSTIEAMIVRDADRLDAMGAIGIARTFAYGGEHGRPLDASIAHFHEKLLLLKDTMATPSGRALAASRHAFLETFLARYEEETSV